MRVLVGGLLFLCGIVISAEPAKVVFVLDGDTLFVSREGQRSGEKVRLIGIDAPETTANAKALKWARGNSERLQASIQAGLQAKSALMQKLPRGTSVDLQYDKQLFDPYHRRLAYVFANGEFINAWMIENGFATPMTISPNMKYAPLFKDLSLKSRKLR